MSSDKKENAYLSVYNVKVNEPLWRQLATCIHGLGTKNTLYVLKKICPSYDPRELTYNNLTTQDLKNLEKTIEQEQMTLNHTRQSVYYANCKNRILSEEFLGEGVSEAGNTLLLNNTLKANQKINIKRLVKMNCLIGYRHFKNYKVHGQSTKSTGRKNKITRGFIKKKQQKKLERKTNASK